MFLLCIYFYFTVKNSRKLYDLIFSPFVIFRLANRFISILVLAISPGILFFILTGDYKMVLYTEEISTLEILPWSFC